MSESATSIDLDLEQNARHNSQLDNKSVRSFTWQGLSVTVKDLKTGEPKKILSNVDGCIHAGQSHSVFAGCLGFTLIDVYSACIGEMLAVMGPSGSGKTTLLNALAHRRIASGSKVEGDICIDGTRPSLRAIRHVSSYVEQEDALIGSLTVQETLYFAARLSLPRRVSLQTLVFFGTEF
jgi:ABC-type uncharacterized transport system YnjBCD ATPase subunit